MPKPELMPMYSGSVNSPIAEIPIDITADQTSFVVSNLDFFPDAPNLATLGLALEAETIRYNGKDYETSSLTGVERGFQGPAKAWVAGTPIARVYTEYDQMAFAMNIMTAATMGSDRTIYEQTLAFIINEASATWAFHMLDEMGDTGEALANLASLKPTEGLELRACGTIAQVVNSSTAMTAVAASSTAMTAVAASSTAMTAVINSSVALNLVVNSSTAMTAVAASSTAMTAVAASSTAMTAVAANSVSRKAIEASTTAKTALANSSLKQTATYTTANWAVRRAGAVWIISQNQNWHSSSGTFQIRFTLEGSETFSQPGSTCYNTAARVDRFFTQIENYNNQDHSTKQITYVFIPCA